MAQQKRRGFLQDLRSLSLSIEESTGGQAIIDGSSDFTVTVLITPDEGVNAHATFSVKLSAPKNYPKFSPGVTFLTPIFHPNISNDMGDVCLSMFNDWNSCYSLLDVVKAIIFLIKNPYFDSPNNSFGYLSESLRHCLADVSHQLLAGYAVKGRSFQPNKNWCTWAKTNGCFPLPFCDHVGSSNSRRKESTVDSINLVNDLTPPSFLNFNGAIDAITDQFPVNIDSSDFSSVHSTSTSIPSVANVRYSIGSQDSSFGSQFQKIHIDYFETQRIVLTLPEKPDDQLPYVFYYCEYIGSDCSRNDLGMAYFRLFSGSLTHDKQSQNAQTSSFRPWFRYTSLYRYTSYRYSFEHSICLSNLSTLFDDSKYIKQTSDIFSDCGFFLLKGLFAERPHASPSSNELSSLHLDDLFVAKTSSTELSSFLMDDPLNCTDLTDGLCSPSPISIASFETEVSDELETSESLPGAISRSSGPEALSEENCNSSLENELYPVPNVDESRFHCCTGCSSSYPINACQLKDFLPSWWVFFQTRWPPTLAPQQCIDLGLNSETRVPPWRANANRLAFDIKLFVQRFPSIHFLLLLDPMTISPWSPIANLLTFKKISSASRDNWQSVLWMTPAMAVSLQTSVDESLFPSPFRLRLVSVVALLSNWVAWFSRLETYSSMGYSRFAVTCIANPVTTSVLSPASLGCGQTPLLDLWPLWSGRLLVRFFCSLCTLSVNVLSPLRNQHLEIRCLFPFSDVDEL